METTSSEKKKEEKNKISDFGAGPAVWGSARVGFFCILLPFGLSQPYRQPKSSDSEAEARGESPSERSRAPGLEQSIPPPAPTKKKPAPKPEQPRPAPLPRQQSSFLPRFWEDLGRIWAGFPPPKLTSRLHRGRQDVFSGRQGDEKSERDQPEAEGEVGQDLQAEHRALRQ